MAKYIINLNVNGERVSFSFNNEYPSENETGDMSILKQIVFNRAKQFVRETYGEKTNFEVTTATYNIWGDLNPKHDFSIDLNHPFS